VKLDPETERFCLDRQNGSTDSAAAASGALDRKQASLPIVFCGTMVRKQGGKVQRPGLEVVAILKHDFLEFCARHLWSKRL